MTTGEELEEAFNYAIVLATTYSLPMTLKAAIDLNLLDIISQPGENAELSPEEIAVKLPSDNPEAASMVDRILRLLASYGIITCSIVENDDKTIKRRYGLTAVSRFLVKNEDGASIGRLAQLNLGRVMLEGWYNLKEAVLGGGISFDKGHGMSMFDYAGRDVEFGKLFNAGMSNHSSIVVKKIIEKYKGFGDIGILVDVGGGTGATLNTIIAQNTSLKGINFDLPHVVAAAPPFPGVEHAGGDMFESVPRGDAIFMKWILHDWSDECCVKILRNCWKALPEKGKVVVMEGVLPELPGKSKEERGLINMDLIMLMGLPGGRERTEREFESLALTSGFSSSSLVLSAFGFSILEFIK